MPATFKHTFLCAATELWADLEVLQATTFAMLGNLTVLETQVHTLAAVMRCKDHALDMHINTLKCKATRLHGAHAR